MTFVCNFIEPKLLSSKRVRGKVLALVNKYGRLIENDLKSTTSTWLHEVVFIKDLRFARGDISVNVYTNDPVWNYLNRGTAVRHAVMTQDFQPKTRQGVIGSFAGSGGVAFVSQEIDMGGIAARNWTIAVRIRHEKNFIADAARAIAEGLET